MYGNIPTVQRGPRPGLPAQWQETGRLVFDQPPNPLDAVRHDMSATFVADYSYSPSSRDFGDSSVAMVRVIGTNDVYQDRAVTGAEETVTAAADVRRSDASHRRGHDRGEDVK